MQIKRGKKPKGWTTSIDVKGLKFLNSQVSIRKTIRGATVVDESNNQINNWRMYSAPLKLKSRFYTIID